MTAFVFGAGCIYVGARERYVTTTVTAAALESRNPPLPLFVIRVARNELTLDATQSRELESLVREADVAVRPIDEARIVFLESLAGSVEEGRYRTVGADAAADSVVRATEQAAVSLASVMQRLHSALNSRQRAVLVQLVRERIESWAPSWGAHSSGETVSDGHRWVTALATESFDSSAAGELGRDITGTARGWTALLERRVAADLPSLDAAARRKLVVQLRTDSLK